MGYLVLARKYRPARFADMVGQEHIARVLGQAIEQSRTHHAYLFCGVRGLGKTSAARILAKAMVCEKGPTVDPCNVCEQCVAITESRSVDVREIDGASHNSVDDIRALREQVHYLPQSARKKIYIIDEVHMLTTSAFNALLKTLEEPPPHVLFIFATTDPHKVLPTILSRVSRLDFRRVPTGPLAEHLSRILEKEGAQAEPQALRVVAQSGEGSVRDALTQMDKVLAFCADPKAITALEVRTILGRADPHALSDIVDAVLQRDVKSILEKLDDCLAQGGDARNICLGLLQEFRNLTVLRLTQDAQALVDEDPSRLAQLQDRATQCEAQHLSQLFDRLMRSAERLDRAPSPRLALEMALIELAMAPPLTDISKAIGLLEGGGVEGLGESNPGKPSGDTPRSPAQSSSASTVQSAASSLRPEQVPSATPSPPAEARSAPKPATSHEEPTTVPKPATSNEEPTAAPPRQAPRPTPAPPREARPPAPDSALAKELWRLVKRSDEPAKKAKPEAPRSVEPKTPPRKSPEPPAPAPAPSAEQKPAAPPPREASLSAVEQAQEQIPSPPADFTLSPAFARWSKMLEGLRERQESMMLAMLSDIGVQELSEDSILLCAAPGNFARQKLQNPGATHEAFTAWLSQDGLDPQILRWQDAPPSLPDAPSWSLFTAHARKAHRHAIEEKAKGHPGVRSLVDALDAEIQSIRVLRDHTGQRMDTPFEP